MFANLTNALDFQSKALVLRAERQRVIASNIANADTPGFSGRDFNFKQAMTDALESSQSSLRSAPLRPGLSASTSGAAHIPLQATIGSLGTNDSRTTLGYTTQIQPTMDRNSVDMDRERANFVDNSVRYEATLRFINGSSRTLLSAIQGQ